MAGAEQKGEEGIPVTDPLTITTCGIVGGCHKPDAKGNLPRISYERATPEGWEEAIKRMVRLNGLKITPDVARRIVKYLATYHGLAPEEAKPVMYMPEHRIQDETIIPNDDVRTACTTCHAFGRAMSWRRTKADWQLLENLHIALYPQAEPAFRRPARRGAQADDSNGAPKKEPVEVAMDYLGKSAPLHTPEWAAWQSRIRAPRITGKWLVSATVLGHGKYVGEMDIGRGGADDEFTTTVTLRSLKDGSTIKRTGTGLVYAGYSWRGRSQGTTKPTRPDDLTSEARETMWIAPDQSYAEGRWYWGGYQEMGFDVTLKRVTPAPTVLAVANYAVKAGTKGAQIRIEGGNFPSTLGANDLDLGAGVKINKIVSHNASEVVADVDVDDKAMSGNRDVGIAGSVLPNGFAVYHKVDYVAVTPDTALARLGGEIHPKGYQQFEAIGYENGADGKPNTADDVKLGPVDVNWSVQQFLAVYGDDDKDFVGRLSDTGFFVPNVEGPNPKRKFGRNNYGNVWVVATAKNEKDKDGKPLQGRSYLVVSVPMYAIWDQPEVNNVKPPQVTE